jgi:hypothetical protein
LSVLEIEMNRCIIRDVEHEDLHLNYKIKCYLGTGSAGYKLNEFKKWNKWLIFIGRVKREC